MAIKLGEMLVKAGKITQEQLDEALKGQVIFGGRLGTNLIEMGYLEEDDISRLLSEKLGVPYVPPEQLMTIPAGVIALIPREMAAKYKVIPLSLEKKKLVLVMEDPSDLAAIDEIAFRTGFNISPVITPEVRLLAAMEKYYQVAREVRYIPVSAKFKREWQGESRSAAEGTTAAEAAKISDFGALAEAPLPEEEVADLQALEVEAAGGEYNVEMLSRDLAFASDRDEIAEILIRFVGQEFERGALFLVKGDVASGWKAVSSRQAVAGFAALQIPLTPASVLTIVAEGKSFYLGPIVSTPDNARMLQGIGVTKPVTAGLIPLLIMGRVVNILYVDGGKVVLGERLDELQQIINKAAMAFEILILRNKIMLG